MRYLRRFMTFSLLMPSYNQARFIGEAVQSVLAQADGDWELIILDNSTDGTPELMAKFTDPRIQFHHQPMRMDVGTCLNWMLERAKGPHFSYIHTDNRLLPCFVGDHKRALSTHPAALAVCDYWEINEAGRRQKLRRRPDPFPLRRLFSTDTIGVPFAGTLELARQVGGFSTDDLADDVMFVLMADAFGPRVHLHKPQMEYRVHGGSRFLQGGVLRVHRAIHRSVVEAYRARPTALPDPYEGTVPLILAHLDKASRLARSLAQHLLKGVPPTQPIWIDGVDPAAFWLAWACTEVGHPPVGFLGAGNGQLLGLPVQVSSETLPTGALCLKPRHCGVYGGSVGPHWSLPFRRLTQGLPPLDHAIKRYPADLMASLLVPLHKDLAAESTTIWVEGEGPLAAYLAFGAETLAGLKVAGWVGSAEARLGPGPAVPSAPAGAPVWPIPKAPAAR